MVTLDVTAFGLFVTNGQSAWLKQLLPSRCVVRTSVSLPSIYSCTHTQSWSATAATCIFINSWGAAVRFLKKHTLSHTHTHSYRGPSLVLRIRWVQGQRLPPPRLQLPLQCGVWVGLLGVVCMKPSGGKAALHTNHYCSSATATQPLIYSAALLNRDMDMKADPSARRSVVSRYARMKSLRNAVVWVAMQHDAVCEHRVGQYL